MEYWRKNPPQLSPPPELSEIPEGNDDMEDEEGADDDWLYFPSCTTAHSMASVLLGRSDMPADGPGVVDGDSDHNKDVGSREIEREAREEEEEIDGDGSAIGLPKHEPLAIAQATPEHRCCFVCHRSLPTKSFGKSADVCSECWDPFECQKCGDYTYNCRCNPVAKGD
jgi:hypothetical protein